MTQRHQRGNNYHDNGGYPPPPRNSFFFKRDTDDLCIVVTANWIARQETWSVNVKVNGELYDAYISDDVWKDARASMEEAVQLSNPPVTVTVTDEETAEQPPALPAAA